MKDLSQLSLLVFALQKSLSALGDELVRPWRMTSAQWKVMGAIAVSGQARTMADIAHMMGMSRQAVLRHVTHLLAGHLLAQHENPVDARAPLYMLTDEGQCIYDEIMQMWSQFTERLQQGISEAQIETACLTLETLLVQTQTALPLLRGESNEKSGT